MNVRTGIVRLLGWARGSGTVTTKALGLFLFFIIVRLPFRSRFLVNWDSVNFALGVEEFDVLHHQPHPPGYIGYVMLGRGMARLTGDANSGLTLLSVIAGGVAVAALYVLARRFAEDRYALAAALLFGTSPLVWYYSSVALTYILAAAITLPFVWACFVARRESSERHLLMAVALLAFLGALRQTDLLLLFPLLVFAAWTFPRPALLRASAVGGGLMAVWLVPLIWTAGGPLGYLRSSLHLADLAGGRTWIFSMNAVGILQNVGLVGIGLLLGLSMGLIVVPLVVGYRIPILRSAGREERRLLLFWGGPAFLIYLTLHTGQLGYVLLILPIGFLLLAGALTQLGAAWRRRALRRSAALPSRSRWVVACAAGSLVVVNAAMFFVLPTASLQLVSSEEENVVTEVAGSMTRRSGMSPRMRQFALPLNDQHWDKVIEQLGMFSPEETAILAEPRGGGSFRHLAYYLPDYRVYGVGPDRRGDYGYLFRAEDRRSDYTVEGLDASKPVFPLPAAARQLVIADPGIQEALDPGAESRRISSPDGPSILIVDAPPGSALLFTAEDDDRRIEIVRRGLPHTVEFSGRGL